MSSPLAVLKISQFFPLNLDHSSFLLNRNENELYLQKNDLNSFANNGFCVTLCPKLVQCMETRWPYGEKIVTNYIKGRDDFIFQNIL